MKSAPLFWLIALVVCLLSSTTTCHAFEHAIFSPEWKIDRINKKLIGLREPFDECMQDAAKEAGSSQGFEILRRACYKELREEEEPLEADRDELAQKLGYPSYKNMLKGKRYISEEDFYSGNIK